MNVKLIGVSELDFTTQDGNRIKGMNMYISYPDENVKGERAEKIFVKEGIAVPEGVKLGSQIDVSFNMRGKVESIAAVK